MSLIRRRKSPGWGKTPTIGRVRKVTKVVKKPRKLRAVKIVNPISGKKINLNGPTHKRLIIDGILDARGVDIRTKKPRAKPKPKTSRLYGDVLGGVMRFLPEKEMVKVSKVTKKPRQSLLSYPFDLSDVKRCQAFADSDFDILMKNQNLNRLALFECVVRRGLVDKVKILLKDSKVDPSDDNNYAIRLASQGGHLEVVKVLLKDERVDPSALDNVAIPFASHGGHLEVVKLILKDSRVDPSDDDNYAIRWASLGGYPGVVKELLKDSRVDPSAKHNYAISLATQGGHVEVLKVLLKDSRVDPSARDNAAIRWASSKGHLWVVKL